MEALINPIINGIELPKDIEKRKIAASYIKKAGGEHFINKQVLERLEELKKEAEEKDGIEYIKMAIDIV